MGHRSTVVGLVAALSLSAPGIVNAQQRASVEEEEIESELEASRERLQKIQEERATLRRQLQGIQSRVKSASTELSEVTREMVASNRIIAELEFQHDRQEALIGETRHELELTRERLVRQRTGLLERLRQIYKRGPLPTLRVLLGAEDLADLLNRYQYMSLIARYDRELLARVTSLEAQLSARERQLAQQLAELEEIQRSRVGEHRQLKALETRQRRALTNARQQQRTAESRLTRLAEDEKRLSSLINTLEARRREAERRAAARGVARSAGTLSRSDAGTLAWPVEGRLIYRFGRQPQANGTVLRWNGIGIAAPSGTGVRAVEGGTAVLAGPFEGYGPTVVVSHGGGYYSLYLYLLEIHVREGETVTRGQLVGSVGGGRTPEGSHIEFQIRSPGGEAVDPLTWLRRRGPT